MQKQPAMIFGNIPKLPAKYAALLMPLILSGLMSGTISMINLWKNLGFIDVFFVKWLGIWLFSWMIAFPMIMLFLPLVRGIMGLFVDMKAPHPPQ